MLTFLPLEQVDEMDSWEGEELNKAKEILAYELTSLVHGEDEAKKAESSAKSIFLGSGDSVDMPEVVIGNKELDDNDSIGILRLLVLSGLCSSNADARRNINQGGVTVNGKKVTDVSLLLKEADLKKGIILRRGKKNYKKVVME